MSGDPGSMGGDGRTSVREQLFVLWHERSFAVKRKLELACCERMFDLNAERVYDARA
jgi:hypothetical protein